jgi:uncharacterized protein DUF3859
MRVPVLIVGWLVAALSGAAAQAPTVDDKGPVVTGITVVNAGTYTGASSSASARAGQQSPTNTIGTNSNWEFVSESTDIDGKVGTQFGIEFRIDGTPPGNAVTLYLVLNFPPQGLRNPNTGNTFHTAKIAFPNVKIGALTVIGYGFDNQWEIVPGTWTEQIWYKSEMLAERTFTVNKPE